MPNDVGIVATHEAPASPLALYHLDGTVTFEPVSGEQHEGFMDHWLTMMGEDPEDYR